MQPALLVLTDTERFPDPALGLSPLLELLPAGSVGVIVRDRALSEVSWLKLADSLRELSERTQQLLIVGDRIEHAARLGAFGVHLASGGMSPRQAREETGVPWVSRSYHDLAQLALDDLRALSAVLVSPVLAARKGRSPLGLARFREIGRELAPALVYALGGVGAQAIGPCFEAGASGVAMIESAFVEAPKEIAQALAERLNSSRRIS